MGSYVIGICCMTYFFSFFLKVGSELQSRISAGISFQHKGPLTMKDLFARPVFIKGIFKVPVFALLVFDSLS